MRALESGGRDDGRQKRKSSKRVAEGLKLVLNRKLTHKSVCSQNNKMLSQRRAGKKIEQRRVRGAGQHEQIKAWENWH